MKYSGNLTKIRRNIIPFFLICFCLLLLTGCPPPTPQADATGTADRALARAKQAAKVSNNIYNTIATQVADEIAVIVEKNREGTITEEDKERLATLNKVNEVLRKYSSAHNAYVAALNT